MTTYIDQNGKVQHYGPHFPAGLGPNMSAPAAVNAADFFKNLPRPSFPSSVPSVSSSFQNMRPNLPGLKAYKKGGLVSKTGPAYLHKGEMVIPKHLVSKLSKSLKNEIKNKV